MSDVDGGKNLGQAAPLSPALPSPAVLPWLSGHLRVLGAIEDIVARAEMTNTALEVLELAQAVGLPLGHAIAAESARVVSRLPVQAQIGLSQ